MLIRWPYESEPPAEPFGIKPGSRILTSKGEYAVKAITHGRVADDPGIGWRFALILEDGVESDILAHGEEITIIP